MRDNTCPLPLPFCGLGDRQKITFAGSPGILPRNGRWKATVRGSSFRPLALLGNRLGMANNALNAESRSVADDHGGAAVAPRRMWFEALLIFSLFFLYTGGPPPDVNETHYLPKAKHYWNPDWCGPDVFLDSADPAHGFLLDVRLDDVVGLAGDRRLDRADRHVGPAGDWLAAT